jgi:hypothetical protein
LATEPARISQQQASAVTRRSLTPGAPRPGTPLSAFRNPSGLQEAIMFQKALLSCLVAAAFAVCAAPATADHWKRHEGRWYFWSEPDTRWYHTDGQYWFYNKDNRWNYYRFDGKFGGDWEIDRDEIEIGDDDRLPKYVAPGIPTKVKVKVKD